MQVHRATIIKTLEYLRRVSPRGHADEDELVRLIKYFEEALSRKK